MCMDLHLGGRGASPGWARAGPGFDAGSRESRSRSRIRTMARGRAPEAAAASLLLCAALVLGGGGSGASAMSMAPLRGGGAGGELKLTAYKLHNEVIEEGVPAHVLSEKRKSRIIKQIALERLRAASGKGRGKEKGSRGGRSARDGGKGEAGAMGGVAELFEFKAGRMVEEGGMLVPLPDLGIILIEQSDEDGLMHFRWEDRRTGEIVHDIPLVQGQAVYERVLQYRGVTVPARVYSLKHNDGDCVYFWMQLPDVEQDDVLHNRVRNLLDPLRYDPSAEDEGWR